MVDGLQTVDIDVPTLRYPGARHAPTRVGNLPMALFAVTKKRFQQKSDSCGGCLFHARLLRVFGGPSVVAALTDLMMTGICAGAMRWALIRNRLSNLPSCPKKHLWNHSRPYASGVSVTKSSPVEAQDEERDPAPIGLSSATRLCFGTMAAIGIGPEKRTSGTGS